MQGESRETNEARGDAPVEEGQAQSGVGGPRQEPSATDALAHAQAETGRMKEAWLRTAAEFDNFRKRTRRELDEARRSGREDLVRSLLPVFDNLERAL